MNRPRKRDRDLPSCVYRRHGAYWFVKRGKWTRLADGDDLAGALREYARLSLISRHRLDELIESVLPDLLHGKADATRELYTVAARKVQGIFREFAPEDVRPTHVATMLDGLRDTPVMANRCASILRMVYTVAVKRGIVDVNPVIGVERHRTAKRTRRITLAEYRAVLEHASPRLAAVMALLAITGQRIGDVLALRRDALLPEGIAFRQAKTGAQLVVAWSDDLRAAVASARALEGRVASLYVVPGRGSRQQAHQPIYRDWLDACAKAKVAGATLHDLRALAATEAQAQGLDAQALLGHTSERMTRTYLRDRTVPVVTPPSIGLSNTKRPETA